jgi:ditrans,polycis-polyprenyl diphosphate synthase
MKGGPSSNPLFLFRVTARLVPGVGGVLPGLPDEPRASSMSTAIQAPTETREASQPLEVIEPAAINQPLEAIEIYEPADQRSDRGQGAAASGLGVIERLACRIVSSGPTPKHVAFIMDGNRRFARERGWDVAAGHRRGYDKLEEALRWCCELGIHGVTVYAFSIENFKRSAEEVAALMGLTEEKLHAMSDEQNVVQRRGVRVRVVGDLSRVSDSLRSEMRRVMRMTQGNTRHTLTVCFSYTSRNEIAASVRRLAGACADGKLQPDDVSVDLIERCLLTASPALPPVDLIVRTSGEKRLSDFLLWQSASCAVVFTSVLWPDLSLVRFLALLLRFQRSQPYIRHVAATADDEPTVRGGRGSGGNAAAADAADAAGASSARSTPATPRTASPAATALLLLLALGAVAAVTAAILLRAVGRPADVFACLAAACVGGWLLLALVGPAVWSPPQTRGGRKEARPVGELGVATAGPAATATESSAATEAARRVRDYLAVLNVDRVL